MYYITCNLYESLFLDFICYFYVHAAVILFYMRGFLCADRDFFIILFYFVLFCLIHGAICGLIYFLNIKLPIGIYVLVILEFPVILRGSIMRCIRFRSLSTSGPP